MKEVSNSLKKMVENVPLLALLMPAGCIFIFIQPAIQLLGIIVDLSSIYYNVFNDLLYVVYLIGLGLCIAASNYWAPGIAFAVKAVVKLAQCFSYFYFGLVIMAVFYAAVAVFFWRCFAQTELGAQKSGQFNNYVNQKMGAAGGEMYGAQGGYGKTSNSKDQFCSKCGQPVEQGGRFCPVCGTPYSLTQSGSIRVPSRPSHNVAQDYSPRGQVYELCGGVMSLVFVAVFVAGSVLQMCISFSAFSIVSYILTILICIGFCLNAWGARMGQLRDTGFTMISGVLITQMVFAILSVVIFAGVAVFAFAAVSEYVDNVAGPIILIILAASILLAFFTAYYNGLRKTVVSARNIVRTGSGTIQTSMFAMVLMCIGTFFQLIAAIAAAKTSSLLLQYMNQILDVYAYGNSDYEVLSGFLNSFFNNSNGSIFATIIVLAGQVLGVVLLFKVRGASQGMVNQQRTVTYR